MPRIRGKVWIKAWISCGSLAGHMCVLRLLGICVTPMVSLPLAQTESMTNCSGASLMALLNAKSLSR